jgi:hypothetical protein
VFDEFFLTGFCDSGCHHGLWSFFVLCYSHFVEQCGYIKKLGDAVAFLMLPPCDCIAKIANNFGSGATFENQTINFGGLTIQFFSDGGEKS